MQSLVRPPHFCMSFGIIFKALPRIQGPMLNLHPAPQQPPCAQDVFVITPLHWVKLFFSLHVGELLHCKGGANWYFFSASSVFPFKESHSVESQSFSRVHCMSHHHVRGGGPQRKGLEGETRKVGWREGEPQQLSFPAWWVFIFPPWDIFQVSLSISSPCVLKKVVWWQLFGFFLFGFFLLSKLNCK